MNRRNLLSVFGIALATTGWLGRTDGFLAPKRGDESSDESPSLPDGMTIETHHSPGYTLADGSQPHREATPGTPQKVTTYNHHDHPITHSGGKRAIRE